MRNPHYQDAAQLREAYVALRRTAPRLRIRDAAGQLGVSELELVCLNLGETVARLKPDFDGLLDALPALERVMLLTRNDFAVHERKAVFPALVRMGSAASGKNDDIHLRFLLEDWKFALTITEDGPRGIQRSIQFFDVAGDAIHKVYLTTDSDEAAFDALISRFRGDDQSFPDISSDARRRSEAGTYWDWDHLGDVTKDESRRVQLPPLCEFLSSIAEAGIPIHLTVANPYVSQRLSGCIHTVKPMETWANILDPGFNLHVREDLLTDAITFRKTYTVDGGQPAIDSIQFNGRDSDASIAFTILPTEEASSEEIRHFRERLDRIPDAASAP
jgi:putative hemin transport protein